MTGVGRQVTLLVAVLATLALNGVASTAGLFGRVTGSISDGLPNPFVPTGLTFSVWGVIFLGLLAFGVFQALPAQRGGRFDRLFWPFLLANVLNMGWLLVWHSLAYALSVLVMLALLADLIWLYVALVRLPLRSAGERWCLGVPTSLYLGWITVATVANVTAWLVSAGVTNGFAGLSAPAWAAVMVVVAALVGAFMLLRFRDVAFALVLAWAFYGVYAKRPDVTTVVWGVLIGAVVLVVAALLSLRGPANRPPRAAGA